MVPRLHSTTRAGRRYLVDTIGAEQGPEVDLDETNVDATNVPTFRFRPGNVVVFKTSTDTYVEANDATGDRNTPAAVTALITNPGSGGWDGNLLIKGHWGELTVVLNGDDTNDAVRDAINDAAEPNDGAGVPIVATVVANRVVITNRDTGYGTHLHAVHATVAAMFGAAGQEAAGRDADYLVTDGVEVDLKDENGNALPGRAPTLRRGHFDKAHLINLTAEAEAVLARRGSRFREAN